MKITLNGEERTVNPPLTVSELLAAMRLGDKRVAVEVNRQVVPRARHDSHQLQDGDQLEVVTLVGGG